MRIPSVLYGAIALVIASNFMVPVQAVAPCQRDTARPRREVRDMNGGWTAYANAIKALKAEMRSTSRGQFSTYDLLVNIHLSNANWVHGYANFFSWHRRYLREVERHLQRISGNTSIMIPYWDWTMDSQAPEASPIFSSSFFGGNGSGTSRCVTTGTFAGWRASFPSSHCLTRRFDAGSRLSAWDSEELIASVIVSSTTYNTLREQIEGGGHASVHVNIGGDMALMQSPNDPIFWSHHAFIDKLWNDWQRRNNWSNYLKYNGPNSDGSQAALTDVMAPWSTPVRNLLWTENLGYCYQNYNGNDGRPPAWLSRRQVETSAVLPTFVTVTDANAAVTKPATEDDAKQLFEQPSADDDNSKDGASDGVMGDASAPVSAVDRSNLLKLRSPNPIPADYIRRNNLNLNKVRQYEAEKRSLCTRLNSLDDYVSPCALVNKPELLEKVVTYPDVTHMYGYVNGKKVSANTGKISNRNQKGRAISTYLRNVLKSRFGRYVNSSKSRYMSVM